MEAANSHGWRHGWLRGGALMQGLGFREPIRSNDRNRTSTTTRCQATHYTHPVPWATEPSSLIPECSPLISCDVLFGEKPSKVTQLAFSTLKGAILRTLETLAANSHSKEQWDPRMPKKGIFHSITLFCPYLCRV
ncbi:hypothetical protein BDY21DRAFT_72564 [Lineolata rhizophorae]|uniref:Uncharacterized protein n=1 Tax=Lineolata rhizophorae TaxID=578093 RepID=A0A6A6NUV7_9PEZI|nr:hypothetical protein BDY21DRAFT_72564 [Lineolata rhizophorae]